MKQMVLKVALWAFVVLAVNFGAFGTEITRSGPKEAPALVFIPGLASHSSLWHVWAEAYASSHSVYVVSASGFAGTEPGDLSGGFLEPTVNEIAARLKSDGVTDAVIVGHSIGGLMSLMVAREAPEQVSRVLVVDSLPFLAGLFMPGITPEAAAAQAKMLAVQMQGMPRDMFITQQKMGLPRLVATADFLPVLEKWSAESDQATVATAFGEALGLDYRPNLSTISADVTVLAAHSAAMPVSRAQLQALFEAQYAGLPHKSIQMVDESRHFIMIDQPEVFGAALKAVVSGQQAVVSGENS